MTIVLHTLLEDALLVPGASPSAGANERVAQDFMAALPVGATRPEAREKLRTEAKAHRWNAATQGAILRAMRARFGAP